MAAPPIIIKKKAAHGGHHGGAWKVAYADFVTAMMALFIVLWLMNSSKQIQAAVSGYFKDPTGTSNKAGTNQSGSGENIQLTKQNMAGLKEQLQQRIQKINDLEKLRKNIEMTITSEGLRIELLESEKGTFFEIGSADLNESGRALVVLLAQELGQLPNHISVEGHTDAKPYAGTGNYSNWELSTDRANTARRLMQQSGLVSNQISQVRGFADQHLRTPQDPFEPSNRRISIIVQYLPNDAAAPDTEGSPGKEGGEPSSESGKHPSAEKPASK
jgi:chemotaxis protein MotB